MSERKKGKNYTYNEEKLYFKEKENKDGFKMEQRNRRIFLRIRTREITFRKRGTFKIQAKTTTEKERRRTTPTERIDKDI